MYWKWLIVGLKSTYFSLDLQRKFIWLFYNVAASYLFSYHEEITCKYFTESSSEKTTFLQVSYDILNAA